VKISRLKALSMLCAFICIALIVSFYVKEYTDNKNELAILERKVENLQQESTLEEADNTENEEVSDEDTEVETDPIVYDGMTLDELGAKLDRTLADTLAGKGYLYASYSLEKGVDPYLAVAITMEETGCAWGCSNLVVSCNNVGGMKGSGCGSYSAFPTIDDGIRAFIDNIARNYVAYGLTTAETMNSKYAENPRWASNVNAYITKIKNN